MTFGARARVSLGAIRHNLDTIRDRSRGARLIAVIKANAYGHGLVPVARALAGADMLAVARLAEARVLRDAGIDSQIVILDGIMSANELDEVIALDLQVEVHSEHQIVWLEKHKGPCPPTWLEIDTGINRLGIRPADVPDAVARLTRCTPRLGLMTHFSSADEPDSAATDQQIAAFASLVDGFDGDISISNSAGLFGWSEQLEAFSYARTDGRFWNRTGLAIYGISPFPEDCGADHGLRPAMQFESRLLAVKNLQSGDRVGYGGTWLATGETRLGIVAAGYGDGYTRYIPTGTPVLVNGRRVPVIGWVSMDLTAVDLGTGANDRAGDPVVLWGDEIPVEEIASCANTIPYQLVTGVTHREEPIYDD